MKSAFQKYLRKAGLIAALLAGQNALYAVLADQFLMKRVLPENKQYIEYINVAVSNFGNDEELETFIEAVIHDFNANIFTMQGKYVEGHKEIMESQRLLSALYYHFILNYYEPDARALLKMSAPIIFHAKDKKAEYYLNSGYAHLRKAEEYRMRGKNSNRFLYSTKINLYTQAIYELRTAKKYALLALTESKIPMVDKKDYIAQSYNEALGLSTPPKVSPYKELEYEIINALSRGLLPDTFPYLLHHADNYDRIFDLVNKESALTQANERLSGSTEIQGEPGANGPAQNGNGSGNGSMNNSNEMQNGTGNAPGNQDTQDNPSGSNQ